MDRWEVEKRLTLKALKDPQFKEKLKAMPKEALREFLEQETDLPLESLDQINVKFKEEGEKEFVIAIPHLPQNRKNMSDLELKAMAGGDCFLSIRTAWLGPC